MILYHGTSARYADDILRRGILPRSESASNGNWNHSVPSRLDCVYLTSVYACYFAHCAVQDDDEHWLLLEIDTDKLDPTRLFPDEDYLEQSSRHFSLLSEYKMQARTEFFREHLHEFADYWADSIDNMGTCAYQGIIPPGAIVRTATFDWKANPYTTVAALDPCITPLNHMICGEKYRQLTEAVMSGVEYKFDHSNDADVLSRAFEKIGNMHTEPLPVPGE